MRSNSLNGSLHSQGSQDKNWKYQSINNKCYKKIENDSINGSSNPKIKHILNLNESVKKHIDT